ncbi:hypothetical protein Tco_1141374 [Tanacetum coccineum]
MHQTFKKSSLAMTHKLDDIIELPKSLPKKTTKEDLECEIVMVKIPRSMSFLGSTNTYDEHLGNVDKMKDEVGNPCPRSTPQFLPSFEEYTTPDVGLNSCSHDLFLSSREVPSVDEPEPQPQPLPNCSSLDRSLGDERCPKPPIKLHSPDSFRMKVVDHLTIHMPPSPHVASFYPKDVYCYYHSCLDDLKKHYGFKQVD